MLQAHNSSKPKKNTITTYICRMSKSKQQQKLILANKYLAVIEESNADGNIINYIRKDLDLPKFILKNECENVPIRFIWLEDFGFIRGSNTAFSLAYNDSQMVFVIEHDETYTLMYQKTIVKDIFDITELQEVYYTVTGKELTLK